MEVCGQGTAGMACDRDTVVYSVNRKCIYRFRDRILFFFRLFPAQQNDLQTSAAQVDDEVPQATSYRVEIEKVQKKYTVFLQGWRLNQEVRRQKSEFTGC